MFNSKLSTLHIHRRLISNWESVVGLEVHAQISSASKLFSGSDTIFGAPVNTCVSLFDAAIPGTLPVLNKKCVEVGIKTALALSCNINSVSMFDRKHYFYADLPAGYQITQQRSALANDGFLNFPVYAPGTKIAPYNKSVRLRQLQLEQDSGKSLHDVTLGRSLVDLNRCGMPLMELVFEPDLKNGEEAASLIKELILILTRLEACSCRMEEGALRVDANVSINRKGEPLGIRTEVKNIGSIRNVAQAVTYEIKRQINVLESGEKIFNETRSWDAENKKTISMRDKEVQLDYRFMPEPNLPPLYLDVGNAESKMSTLGQLTKVEEIRKQIPELPSKTRENLKNKFKISEETSIILVNEGILLSYFLEVMQYSPKMQPKFVCNILINDLIALCNKKNIDIKNCTIRPHHLLDLFRNLEQEIINLSIARKILEEIHENPNLTPSEIIVKKQWKQINDRKEIEKLCRETMKENIKVVNQYRNGKKKALFALAGNIAKITNDRANMTMVVKILEELMQ